MNLLHAHASRVPLSHGEAVNPCAWLPAPREGPEPAPEEGIERGSDGGSKIADVRHVKSDF